MESFEDSNCHSMNDSFSLYERYMRSFNVVDIETFVEENNHHISSEAVSLYSTCDYESSNTGPSNIDLSAVQINNIHEECGNIDKDCNSNPVVNLVDKSSLNVDGDVDVCEKVRSLCASPAESLLESSATAEHSLLTEKSDVIEAPVSSDESKTERFKHPVFITSTMENSNNAVDSVPMFRNITPSESVFKLPISELSFNGTIKHVQKLQPIVDPISALSSAGSGLVELEENTESKEFSREDNILDKESSDSKEIDISDERSTCETNKVSESTGDSQYEGNPRRENRGNEESAKWGSEQSVSSLEPSFDSGVRSPDMFSDEEELNNVPEPEPFWSFIKDYEAYDKKRVVKVEEVLLRVLPPPSITVIKTDVTEMLEKYYCFLPAFSDDANNSTPKMDAVTPTKLVSFVQIPTRAELSDPLQETTEDKLLKSNISSTEDEFLKQSMPQSRNSLSKDSMKSDNDLNMSFNDKSIVLKMGSETEAKEAQWPDILKCKYHDVYYNVTKYSEEIELLALRYGERFVSAETDTSISVYSRGQSPSSASKRKALRLKSGQAKSPGRRLSHLARRRQAFSSASIIGEKVYTSASRMVLIDKKKLINTTEPKSSRLRRTPGKKTPAHRTPGKKFPTKSSNNTDSNRKKVTRRFVVDLETTSISQPARETLKRALFISPENRKGIPQTASTSVPVQITKSKRALFGSPVKMAETKSLDGSKSEVFLKRKRSQFDSEPDGNKSKVAKSLSYGGDTIGSGHTHELHRHTSEVFARRSLAELNELNKKKLLWAVSEALRMHGWRMTSPGFREKASSLSQLTRRLLTLPPHAARLTAPTISTTETILKLARQYVFAIIKGRSVEDCFQEEVMKINNEGNTKITGYISATAYQQLKVKQSSSNTFTSKIKENSCNAGIFKQEQTRSIVKNILQDKLTNIDSNSNSSSGLSMFDKVGLYKSNSMPSFEDAAKMRARRQISFDNIEFPKR